jgi:perosamine synthetase
MEEKTRTLPFGKPLLDESDKQAVLDVLNGTTLVHGPRSRQFEVDFAAYTSSTYAVALGSCTAGLHLAYLAHGIKSGDEVIVPALTHTATAHAVEFTGATPVFVDAEPRTGNIDLEQIEEKITDRTKALSLVHFLGMPVDMQKIRQIAERKNLFIVEDCALALGATFHGRHVGTWGDAGVFSFYPVKHITTAEGGMLLTGSERLATRIQRLRAFGVDMDVHERKTPGSYDVTLLGYNYRMNELEAALGIQQLKKLPLFLKSRRENYEALKKELLTIKEIELFQSTHGPFQSGYYCLSIILKDKWSKDRSTLQNLLAAQGIGTSVYYPRPVPHLGYYRGKYGFPDESFPIARRISSSSIALPVGPHLNVEDMHSLATSLKEALHKISG